MPGDNLLGSTQTLDASVNTVISEFILRREVKSTMRTLARSMPLKPHEGPSKYVNLYNRFTAYDLTDGVDMVFGQQVTDTQTSFTPGEVGLKVVIPKTTIRRIADTRFLKNVGMMIEYAYDRKEDTDGCTQLASFTNGLGSAGTVASPGHLIAAETQLSLGQSRSDPELVPKPYFGVFHGCSVVALAGRIMPLATTPAGGTAYGVNTGAHLGVSTTLGPGNSMTDELLKEGPQKLSKFGGVEVYIDNHISVDSSDDAINAVFSREGLIYVPEMEPSENQTVDYSARAVEIVYVGSYGWGNFRPGILGLKMTFDASMPTS